MKTKTLTFPIFIKFVIGTVFLFGCGNSGDSSPITSQEQIYGTWFEKSKTAIRSDEQSLDVLNEYVFSQDSATGDIQVTSKHFPHTWGTLKFSDGYLRGVSVSSHMTSQGCLIEQEGTHEIFFDTDYTATLETRIKSSLSGDSCSTVFNEEKVVTSVLQKELAFPIPDSEATDTSNPLTITKAYVNGCTKGPGYYFDEGPNSNTCWSNCDCDGERYCVFAYLGLVGVCQGNSNHDGGSNASPPQSQPGVPSGLICLNDFIRSGDSRASSINCTSMGAVEKCCGSSYIATVGCGSGLAEDCQCWNCGAR